MNCPSCKQPMEAKVFGRKGHGGVTLDLCYACHAIWFDHMESTRLTPGGVLELFKTLHAHRGEAQRPLATQMRCVHCSEPLAEVSDLGKSGRFSYYRCGAGHGRLTSFFQFLREKQFVRSLNGLELAQLRAEVKQVRCSSCGGPVDLQNASACGYCRAPISILDADAVERALHSLKAAENLREHKASVPDVEALLAAERQARKDQQRQRPPEAGPASPTVSVAADLVEGAITILVGLLD